MTEKTIQGQPVPEFSIVFETFNLTRADLDELEQCIESLYAGEITPDDACEILVLDSGSAAPELFAELAERYPRIEVRKVPPQLAFGDIRALSQRLPRGELIATFDSDCILEPGWLDHTLEVMATRPEVKILAGEFTVRIRGPYSLAVAMAWIFPPFTSETEPAPASHYYPNGCLLRRELVERLPYPAGVPMRRGQAIVHAKRLRRAGEAPWRHPRARGYHTLPGFGAILHRFLVIGHDSVELGRISGEEDRFSHRDRFLFPEPAGRLATLVRRCRTVLAADRRRWLGLPVALPLIALFTACYAAGRLLAHLDGPRARRWLGIHQTPPDMLRRLEAGELEIESMA